MSWDFPNNLDTFWRFDSTLGNDSLHGPWTLSCWVRVNALAGGHTFFTWGDRGASNDTFIAAVQGASSFPIAQLSGTDTAQFGTGLTALTWHHIIATVDGTNVRIIMDDGVVVSTTVTASDTGNNDGITIGNNDDNTPSAPWDGQVAELAFYNYVIGAPDVTSLAGGSNPMEVGATPPLVYTSMRESDGSANYGSLGGSFTITTGSGDWSAQHPTVDLRPGADSISGHLQNVAEVGTQLAVETRGRVEAARHAYRKIWFS